LVRYADDFIVTAKTEEIASESIKVSFSSSHPRNPKTGLSTNTGKNQRTGTGFSHMETDD